MSDNATAALLLGNRLTRAAADPLTAKAYWSLLDRVPEPRALLGLAADAVAAIVGDVELADRVLRLLDAATAFAVEREHLLSTGIRVLSTFDDDYPARLRDRLGPQAPPFLLVSGELGLARGDLAVVGSRDIDDAGAKVAAEAARGAVAHGWRVVSGLARGVDQIAMSAAVEAGGPTLGIPSEGLRRVARQATVRGAVHEGSLCLLSPYGPDSPFTAGAAMGRNKLIYAMADVTFVVASAHNKGGTWQGAKEAIAKGYGPVSVWMGDGAGEGNSHLVRAGARSVDELEQLFEGALISEPIAERAEADQASPEAAAASRVSECQPYRNPGPTLLSSVPEAPGASAPFAPSTCWCGCGKPTDAGEWFMPGHELKALKALAASVGGTPELLAQHGFGPDRPVVAKRPAPRNRSRGQDELPLDGGEPLAGSE
jgi:predicted Rossmann fold nucleotide-binding protein DprA/Smf involved in DNA uptake